MVPEVTGVPLVVPATVANVFAYVAFVEYGFTGRSPSITVPAVVSWTRDGHVAVPTIPGLGVRPSRPPR